jgi:hypothetical protein
VRSGGLGTFELNGGDLAGLKPTPQAWALATVWVSPCFPPLTKRTTRLPWLTKYPPTTLAIVARQPTASQAKRDRRAKPRRVGGRGWSDLQIRRDVDQVDLPRRRNFAA